MTRIRQLDPPGGDGDVIEFLERMLKEAKKGRALSVAIVLAFPGRVVGSGFKLGQDADLWCLSGGVAYLQSRICEAIENGYEE